MKKTLFTAITASLILFSANANAACEESKATYYQVKNGKATKATATVAECGNAYGGSQNFMFKDGTTLSAGTELNDNGKVVNEWLTINDKNVVRVKNPKGVPSAYACFALPNSKNAYCVK